MPAAATVPRPTGTGERSNKHRIKVDILAVGAATINAGATEYLQKTYLAANAAARRYLLQKPPGWKGKATRLYVVAGTAPTAAVIDTITVNVNGVATALTGTMTTVTTTLEVGGNIDLEPGDDIDVEVVKDAGSSLANVMAYVAIEDR
jgi:hypothetical protein